MKELSNNMHSALDTDNKEAAIQAVLDAGGAYNSGEITLEEYRSIRQDFEEVYPDII